MQGISSTSQATDFAAITRADLAARFHTLPDRGRIAPKRKRQRIPSAKMIRRRRVAGGADVTPDIRGHLTLAQVAVAIVIAHEVQTHRDCRLSNKEIGDKAGGCCVATVKAAKQAIARMGAITLEERRASRFKSETTIIRIVDKEWLALLAPRRPWGQKDRRLKDQSIFSLCDPAGNRPGNGLAVDRMRAARAGEGKSRVGIWPGTPEPLPLPACGAGNRVGMAPARPPQVNRAGGRAG